MSERSRGALATLLCTGILMSVLSGGTVQAHVPAFAEIPDEYENITEAGEELVDLHCRVSDSAMGGKKVSGPKDGYRITIYEVQQNESLASYANILESLRSNLLELSIPRETAHWAVIETGSAKTTIPLWQRTSSYNNTVTDRATTAFMYLLRIDRHTQEFEIGYRLGNVSSDPWVMNTGKCQMWEDPRF